MDLAPDDIARFDRYNTAYKARFEFPFVICARRNKKEAILAAFPERLTHTRDEEIATALAQIFEIARLRMEPAVCVVLGSFGSLREPTGWNASDVWRSDRILAAGASRTATIRASRRSGSRAR